MVIKIILTNLTNPSTKRRAFPLVQSMVVDELYATPFFIYILSQFNNQFSIPPFIGLFVCFYILITIRFNINIRSLLKYREALPYLEDLEIISANFLQASFNSSKSALGIL